MGTYFVTGNGSQTAPFDTEVKGANTFKYLKDNIVEADGDIIEVSDNALIDDSAAQPSQWSTQVTIRSYSGNSTKPTIKMNDGSSQFGMNKNFTITDLKMYWDSTSSGSNGITVNNDGGLTDYTITGCEIWTVGSFVATTYGIEVFKINLSGSGIIEKNKIYNVAQCVRIFGAAGGE